MTSTFTHLECSACRTTCDGDLLATVCPQCAKPLLARYDLEAARRGGFTLATARRRGRSLWRFEEVLPVRDPKKRVDLGEGTTPLLAMPALARELGLRTVDIKDESFQPTLSFKARGMALAVSRAYELGVKELAVPSAGNAAAAAAAYGARAGMPVHVAMPEDAPELNIRECRAAGADVTLVKGLISDAGRVIREGVEKNGWFDLSTLREPYRIEGKKTMGYEIADQFEGDLPDAIFYPTGGGTGLIGMWKAFDEMEALGWIGSKRPKMISVQAAGCAPIVRAFEAGAESSEFFDGASTIAAGLRVPKALGDFIILQAVRASEGVAIAVTDEELLEDLRALGRSTGLILSPEGAATVVALRHLVKEGVIAPDSRVVLFNTASGLKYDCALVS